MASEFVEECIIIVVTLILFFVLKFILWGIRKISSFAIVLFFYFFNICLIVVMHRFVNAGMKNNDAFNGLVASIRNFREILNLTFNK